MATKFANANNSAMNSSVVSESVALETNYSLYLIDSDQVSYCRFCSKAVVHHADFNFKHRLFVIETNEDLKSFLDKAVAAFPSSQGHPHYPFLREVSDRSVSGDLNFKSDFGTTIEAFQHFSTDISLTNCEPGICNLTHIKYNKYPWMHITLNLENCQSCIFQEQNIYQEVQDYSPSYIPSWQLLEDSEPACTSVFRLQQDAPWTKNFHRFCHTCKRRRLLRGSYTRGIRKLWLELYSDPFCSCSFLCLSGF